MQLPLLPNKNDAMTLMMTKWKSILDPVISQVAQISMPIVAPALGELKSAALTLAQFQATYGSGWVLANGATAVGSAYAKASGNNTLPNIAPSGTVSTFIRIN